LIQVRRPLRVLTDVQHRRGWFGGASLHRDTIVFAGDAPTGAGRWLPLAGLASSPLAPALGLVPAPEPVGAPAGPTAPPGRRRQRFAAYGHVTDPAGNVLLSLIAEGFPGAGEWHLPGGGTEFGESPVAALHREIHEETGQEGEIGELLSITDHRVIRGRADFHGVRAVYAVRVARPTPARVLEVGGSTASAAWFTLAEARALRLTDVARQTVG
jgi:ADP-ribose pyrophosphatase YjhB (NUDIX family)